jgi:SAM-dependent methyltransferase
MFCIDKVPVRAGTVDIIDYNGDDYRGYWHGPGRHIVNRIETDAIARLCRPSRGWFIDLGCGYGRLLPCYAAKVERVVMVDYAVNNLRLAAARARHLPDVHFVAADAYRLPFRPGVFEGGVCVRLFHHIKDPAMFLHEVGRVMADNGFMTMSYVNSRNLPRLLRWGFDGARGGHRKLSSMMYATSPAIFRRLARGLGFTPIKIRGTGFIDQVLNKEEAGRRLDAMIDTCPAVGKVLEIAEVAANWVLGSVEFVPLQFVRMRKDQVGGHVPSAPPRTFLETLQCVACGGSLRANDRRDLECTSCGTVVPNRDGIYDFRPADSTTTTEGGARE